MRMINHVNMRGSAPDLAFCAMLGQCRRRNYCVLIMYWLFTIIIILVIVIIRLLVGPTACFDIVY